MLQFHLDIFDLIFFGVHVHKYNKNNKLITWIIYNEIHTIKFYDVIFLYEYFLLKWQFYWKVGSMQ